MCITSNRGESTEECHTIVVPPVRTIQQQYNMRSKKEPNETGHGIHCSSITKYNRATGVVNGLSWDATDRYLNHNRSVNIVLQRVPISRGIYSTKARTKPTTEALGNKRTQLGRNPLLTAQLVELSQQRSLSDPPTRPPAAPPATHNI